MRWTWRKALTRVEAASDLFGFRVVAGGANSTGPEGLTFKVYLDGKMLDDVHFFDGGCRYLYYYVPGIKGKEIEIGTEVDRTFNPLRMKINEDGRDLGVAVSPLSFLKIMPKDGVGFYGWESEQRAVSSEQGVVVRFRWTGKRASVGIEDCGLRRTEEGLVVFLRCGHPGIDKEPVLVRILGDGDLLRYVEFGDYGWKRVEFGVEELKKKEILTYEVSRTWNPKRMGVSKDDREFGVAVAVP